MATELPDVAAALLVGAEEAAEALELLAPMCRWPRYPRSLTGNGRRRTSSPWPQALAGPIVLKKVTFNHY